MKRELRDLAIFGGSPEFEVPLHVGRPDVGDRQKLINRVEDAINRRWLTNDGPLVQEFEAQLCSVLGVKHCLVTANGTIGLEIATRALGLKGEVIVPAFTFVATAHALEWIGVKPVFADVRPGDYTLDPDLVEDLITPQTTGILGVHLWGRPCDTEALEDIGERFNLRVYFDAAHAIGVSSRGRMVGGFGDAEVFSFHATKVVSAFEGGAIATNDDVLAEKIRRMRNFGFSGIDAVEMLGTNGKMSEISAAMGITSLEAFASTVAHNKVNYERYRARLESVEGFSVLKQDSRSSPNYQYLVTLVDQKRLGLSRDDLVSLLWGENVYARRYFFPGLHRVEPYLARSDTPRSFSVADRLSEQVLVLPTGPAVSVEDVDAICDLVAYSSKHGLEIGGRLHEKP